MDGERTNKAPRPWVRANLETFNVETLALIPPGQQEEYARIMRQLAHTKGIAALALEQVYLVEQERHDFFEPFINTKPSEEGVCDFVTTPTEVDAPDYTPVTDLNEYREQRDGL